MFRFLPSLRSRPGRTLTSLALMLPLCVLLPTFDRSVARASCPVGLSRAASLEWQRVSDLGLVDRLFELFGDMGPHDGQSRWRSIMQDEDGRIRRISDFVCSEGRLLLVAQHDQRHGLRLWLEGGVPILVDPPTVDSTVITGVARLTLRQPSETVVGTFWAELTSASASLVSIPFGEIEATVNTLRVVVIAPPGNVLLDTEMTIWWREGSDRYPLRIRYVQHTPSAAASTLELLEVTVPRLTPLAGLRYIGSPEPTSFGLHVEQTGGGQTSSD